MASPDCWRQGRSRYDISSSSLAARWRHRLCCTIERRRPQTVNALICASSGAVIRRMQPNGGEGSIVARFWVVLHDDADQRQHHAQHFTLLADGTLGVRLLPTLAVMLVRCWIARRRSLAPSPRRPRRPRRGTDISGAANVSHPFYAEGRAGSGGKIPGREGDFVGRRILTCSSRSL